MIGEKFSRLTVVAEVAPYRSGKTVHKRYECRCECGEVRLVTGVNLRRGNTKSCGCLQRSVARGAVKHGCARRGLELYEYRIWCWMRERCERPRNARYESYGGRGIEVCDRWSVFDNFLADMGTCPPGMSLDRINNDGNYEPSNCRWATALEQRLNTRPRSQCGFRGVSSRKCGTYQACITVNKKRINLGTFSSAFDASKAYADAFAKFYPGIRIPRLTTGKGAAWEIIGKRCDGD